MSETGSETPIASAGTGPADGSDVAIHTGELFPAADGSPVEVNAGMSAPQAVDEVAALTSAAPTVGMAPEATSTTIVTPAPAPASAATEPTPTPVPAPVVTNSGMFSGTAPQPPSGGSELAALRRDLVARIDALETHLHDRMQFHFWGLLAGVAVLMAVAAAIIELF